MEDSDEGGAPVPEIVVVGSLHMDLVANVPSLPVPGETIIGHDHFRNPGGKGGNQAVAAARLGRRVGMVGQVGDDADGRELLATLERENVDTTYRTWTASRTWPSG